MPCTLCLGQSCWQLSWGTCLQSASELVCRDPVGKKAAPKGKGDTGHNDELVNVFNKLAEVAGGAGGKPAALHFLKASALLPALLGHGLPCKVSIPKWPSPASQEAVPSSQTSRPAQPFV